MTHRVTVDIEPSQYKITEKAFWSQTIDRTIKTAIQALIVFFAGGVAIAQVNWGSALTSVGVTVVITLVLSLASARLYEVESFYIDLAQRSARTFFATFGGALAGLATYDHVNWKELLSLSLAGVLLSVGTSFASKGIGVPNTASLLRGAELYLTEPPLSPKRR